MNSLGIWTIVMIIYQTAICVIISWLTLTCRLAPDSNELHEVTLMKLLYLYDPEACGRIHFYNFTVRNYDDLLFSTIMWPVSNPIAAQFRRAIRLWLSLHIIWLVFSIVNVTHGRRPCGFYAVLVPFTITGLAMLVVDVVFMAMFLQDTAECNTEMCAQLNSNILKPILSTFDHLITFNRCMWLSLVSWPDLSLIALPQNGVVITCVAILDYMNRGGRSLRWIIKVYPWHTVEELQHATLEDTSWIPLLFAFTSCRGIVQWIINFWMVKDNYFAGLGFYRQLQKEAYRSRARLKE